MAAVQNLCVRGIWLKQGQVAFDGPVDEAVRNYLGYLSSNADRAFVDNPERTGDGRVQLTGARILNGFNQPSQHLVAGEPMSLEFSYKNPARASQAYAATTVFNHLGVAATSFDMRLTSFLVEDLASEGKFICRVPNVPFPVGQYRVAVAIYVDEQIADLIPNALVFNVESTTFFENGSRTPSLNYCTCMVSHNWQHKITEPRLPAPGTAAE
jgi:lipopolysaccharide transport system ATP-binding protein